MHRWYLLPIKWHLSCYWVPCRIFLSPQKQNSENVWPWLLLPCSFTHSITLRSWILLPIQQLIDHDHMPTQLRLPPKIRCCNCVRAWIFLSKGFGRENSMCPWPGLL